MENCAPAHLRCDADMYAIYVHTHTIHTAHAEFSGYRGGALHSIICVLGGPRTRARKQHTRIGHRRRALTNHAHFYSKHTEAHLTPLTHIQVGREMFAAIPDLHNCVFVCVSSSVCLNMSVCARNGRAYTQNTQKCVQNICT